MANNAAMPADLAAVLLRKSVGSMRGDRVQCCECRRTPLGGELVHVSADRRVLCALCVAALSDDERAPLRSERVPAGERRVALLKTAV